MFSLLLRKPFAQAVADGVIPPNLATPAGSWGAVHDSGETELDRQGVRYR